MKKAVFTGAAVALVTRNDNEMCQTANIFRLPPAVKAEQHIGSHDKIQDAVRIGFFEAAQGVHGIAPAAARQFHIRDLRMRNFFRHAARHFQALHAGSRMLRHGLVRRNVVGNEQQAVKL